MTEADLKQKVGRSDWVDMCSDVPHTGDIIGVRVHVMASAGTGSKMIDLRYLLLQ